MEERIRERFSELSMPENPRPNPDVEIPGHDEIRFASFLCPGRYYSVCPCLQVE